MHNTKDQTIPNWLDKRSVCRTTGASEMTLWRWEQRPTNDPLKFPTRFYVGGKAYWDAAEIVDWMKRAREIGSVAGSSRHPSAKAKAA